MGRIRALRSAHTDAIFRPSQLFLTMQVTGDVLNYKHMSQSPIVCKPTADTFVRFGIVIAAIFGFAIYFFYDGYVGYRVKNEVYFSYKAFAELGLRVSESNALSWAELRNKPLIATVEHDGEPMVQREDSWYPLPVGCEAARSCPPEVLDFAAMNRGWNECWKNYTGRMHYPMEADEHPHDLGAIREQWIMGGLFIIMGSVLVFFALRTRGRVLSLEGDTITAAGQTFRVADIQSLDLRQWGPGYKGCAYFKVNGRRIKADGMTYGGFNKDKGEPAEAFMKAVLAQYKGEVIEYEVEKTASSDS